MAFFENIAVTTLQDVIDAIEAFAVANAGFTALTPVNIGKTTTMRILLKGGMYYYFYGDSITVSGFGSLGRINSRLMRVQPTAVNYAIETGTLDAQRYPNKTSLWGNTNGPYVGLNLYSNGSSVHVVLEVYGNVFAHLSFGIVEKFGAWTGGEYVTSNYMPVYVVATGFNFITVSGQVFLFDGGVQNNDVGSASGTSSIYHPLPSGALNNYIDYADITSDSNPPNTSQRVRSSAYATTALLSITHWMYTVSPSKVTLRAPLIPIYMFIGIEGALSTFHLAGEVSSAKYLNIQSLDPKELVDANWRVYPYVSKFGDTFIAPVSGNVGIAYNRA